jgi:hypothetical protein
MELYKRLIEIVDANVINCLIPMILTLLFIKLIFKQRFEVKRTLNVIRWIIIIYTVITWSFYLIGMATTNNPEEYAFINRATGPYAWAYWLMFLSALILPLTLLVQKLASNFWYVLLVSFAMKSGIYFERFVIITTTFHGDYIPEDSNNHIIKVIASSTGMIFLQGVIITIVILRIFEVSKKNSEVTVS